MIVADTGPLIAFARLGRLDLLQHVAGEVAIPEAVYEDLCALLPTHLHVGEAEAILLAEELKVPLLIDERRGRKVALDRGIDALGSLAILAAAKRQGLIAQARPLLGALLAAGYWIDEELVPVFLKELGEAQPD